MVDPTLASASALKSKKGKSGEPGLAKQVSDEVGKSLTVWSRIFAMELQQLKQAVVQKLDDALCPGHNFPTNLKPRWAPAGKLKRSGFADDDIPLEYENGGSPVFENGCQKG